MLAVGSRLIRIPGSGNIGKVTGVLVTRNVNDFDGIVPLHDSKPKRVGTLLRITGGHTHPNSERTEHSPETSLFKALRDGTTFRTTRAR